MAKIPALLEHKLDTEIVKIFLQIIPSCDRILESGVFVGSWCLAVNQNFKNVKPKFIGVEDLSFIKNKQIYSWYKNFSIDFDNITKTLAFQKINCLKELENFIKIRSNQICNCDIDITLFSSIPLSDKYNVIHHDCAINYDTNCEFYDLYKDVLKDDGVLIIDNFGGDIPMRTLSISKYINNGDFFVIGTGKRTLFLTKNKKISQFYLNKIKMFLNNNTNKHFDLHFLFDSFLSQEYFFCLPEATDLN